MKITRYAPLFACGIAALVTGVVACATKSPESPFKGNAKVVAIYAIDAEGANTTAADPRSGGVGIPLPDVLLFTNVQEDKTKTSKAPVSFGGFRIEFDQPMNGQTLANNNDIAAQSFCSTITGGDTVKLIDTGAGNALVPASVCYDPTSALGQNPHVNVVVGAASGGSPFTCNNFSPNTGTETLGYATLSYSHAYAITLDATRIQTSGGASLDVDSGGTYAFQTSGFDVMAVGYQDPVSGFYHWAYKPYAGFMKDLAAEPADTFAIPADGTNLLIVTTAGPAGAFVQKSPTASFSEITVTRSDNSVFPQFGFPLVVGVDTFSAGLGQTDTSFLWDPRVTTIQPGAMWEPGVQYTLNVASTLQTPNGVAITATGAPYAFKAATATPAVTFQPATGETVQPKALTNSGATLDDAPAGSGFGWMHIALNFNYPVDPTTVNTTNVKVTDKGGATIAGTITRFSMFWGGPNANSLDEPSANHQVFEFAPAAPLPYENTIHVDVYGVTVASAAYLTAHGQPVPAATSQFNTGTFRINRVRDARNPPVTTGTIDRYTSTPPEDLFNDSSLYVEFTDAATGVTGGSAGTVELHEINGTAVGAAIPIKVTQRTGGPKTGARWRVAVDTAAATGYLAKFGQSYQIRAKAGITSATSGTALKAESCLTNPTPDCTDIRTFATAKFTPGCSLVDPHLISPANASNASCRAITRIRNSGGTSTIGFAVNFPYPLKPTSVDLTKNCATPTDVCFKLLIAGTKAPIPITCTAVQNAPQLSATPASASDPNQFRCLANSPLPVNTNIVATAVFPHEHPAIVTDSLTSGGVTVNTDTASGTFFGTVTRTLLTDCQ